jgi:alpha-D-ribose 1-methylphosphonate 5-triphosphate synthase subunit PhnG
LLVDAIPYRVYLSRHLNNSADMSNNPPTDHPDPARRRWMAVLARASASQIHSQLTRCAEPPPYTKLRGPEPGLVMVRGRAGGGGSPFNLGEMTVTRCTVRTEAGFIGHAYIPGRDTGRAELAALVDAMMQDPAHTRTIEAGVIAPLETRQAHDRAARSAKAATTRVNFFAMQTMRT